MSYEERFDIIAFRSRQHAFHFNQLLKNEGYNTQIMSTPKEVAMGCGLSIRFSSYMTPQILRIFRVYNKPIIGFFHVDRSGSRSTLTKIPHY